MIQIPPPTKVRYDALLAQHHIPEKFHPDYLKWLRYYLDFCQKYKFKEADKKSLPNFIKKLKAKKQTDQQQNQALLLRLARPRALLLFHVQILQYCGIEGLRILPHGKMAEIRH